MYIYVYINKYIYIYIYIYICIWDYTGNDKNFRCHVTKQIEYLATHIQYWSVFLLISV